MGKEIKFNNTKIEKQKFHRYKNPMFFKDVDIDKILTSNKTSSVEKNYKYFIGYLDDDYNIKYKPLCIMLPKRSTYVKNYDGETKWMNFFIKDNDLLKRYNDIWKKVSYSIKKELDCEPIYNKKILKTKIRSYGDEAPDFHTRKIPEAGCNYICWMVILIDSVLKKDDNYYPQVFLKEYKCLDNEKKMIRYITDDLKFSCENSDEFDEE